jgi:hypothetical protein
MTAFTMGTALRNMPQGDKSRGNVEGSSASVVCGGDLGSFAGGSAGAAVLAPAADAASGGATGAAAIGGGSAAGAASRAGGACARTEAPQRVAPSAKATRFVLAKP